MDKKKLTAKERLTRLRELISYYRDLYYAKDASEISDQAYDALVAELVSLEEKLEGERSDLTESVGTLPSVAFAKVTHKVPQWSFDNVFSFAELQAWEDRLIRYLEKEGIDKVRPTYVTEHKIDGLKIVLEYKKGILYQALTRGDGEVGEDVTHTAKTIKAEANLANAGYLPIDFDAIRSREQLVRVFNTVSLEKCGDEARNWNHRVIADQLVEAQPRYLEPANEVAGLYERARYAPTDEDLTQPEFADARRDLRTIAGVPS